MKIWFQNRRVKYKKEGPYDAREPCRCLRTCSSSRNRSKHSSNAECPQTLDDDMKTKEGDEGTKSNCSGCWEEESDSDLSSHLDNELTTTLCDNVGPASVNVRCVNGDVSIPPAANIK